jgi:hypothetical protein
MEPYVRETPPKKQFESDVRTMLDRGSIYFLFILRKKAITIMRDSFEKRLNHCTQITNYE